MAISKFDFSKESGYEFIKKLLKKHWKKDLLEKWWNKCWNNREKVWNYIGYNMRRDTCIPKVTGDALAEVYKNEWMLSFADIGHHYYPDELCSGKIVDSQSVPTKNGEQKLSRFLIQWLIKNKKIKEKTATDFIAQLQDRVRKSNGAKIVISANPVDILLTSMFTTGWSSCHNWAVPEDEDEEYSAYSAGNWQFALDWHVLIAYSYENYKIFKDEWVAVNLPCKKWRQLIFVTEDKQAGIFYREYPSAMPELQHTKVRETLAQILTNEESPEWKFSRGFDYFRREGDIYFYADDCVNGAIKVLKAKEEKYKIEPIYMHDVICPTCNKRRFDDALECAICINCHDKRRTCGCCGEDIRVTSRNDWDGWIHVGDDSICPNCTDQYTRCDYCAQYFLVDDEEVHAVHNLRYKMCNTCAPYNQHTYCEGCDMMVLNTDYRKKYNECIRCNSEVTSG